jgi:hypothetical protein
LIFLIIQLVGAALFQPAKWHLIPEKGENQPLLGRKKSVHEGTSNNEPQVEEETNFGSTSVLIPQEVKPEIKPMGNYYFFVL